MSIELSGEVKKKIHIYLTREDKCLTEKAKHGFSRKDYPLAEV